MPALTQEQVDAVATLYRTTQPVRLRPRAQLGLLAVEQHLGVRATAGSVRAGEGPVRCGLKRSGAQGLAGLQDAWAGGAPATVTAAYQDQVRQAGRRRPRRLELPYSPWTLQRLADSLAERTAIRGEQETVRVHRNAAEIVLSRPHQTISSPDPDSAVKKPRAAEPS